MRTLYGNYRVDQGAIWVQHQDRWVDLVPLPPHELIAVRQQTIGYVSQFLRVIPRVPALTVAAEPLMELGVEPAEAFDRVSVLFKRLNLPERLWALSPTTFSGGEKQRVNIARTFAVDYAILLLDEPTSALDEANSEIVVDLIRQRQAQGCAVIGIFHDQPIRASICKRCLHFGDRYLD
jgi:alpha-D-ribose 1-methylphosphonate 5-triphosphate synthase subunit PhnL